MTVLVNSEAEASSMTYLNPVLNLKEFIQNLNQAFVNLIQLERLLGHPFWRTLTMV